MKFYFEKEENEMHYEPEQFLSHPRMDDPESPMVLRPGQEKILRWAVAEIGKLDCIASLKSVAHLKLIPVHFFR